MEGFGGTGQATEGTGGGSIINSARTVLCGIGHQLQKL